MNRALIALAIIVGLFAAGCSNASPPSSTEPTYQQQLRRKVDARAEYEAYLQRYQARRQRFRMEQWQAMQARAARQIAEEQRRRDAIQERVRQRWASFQ